MEAAARGFSDDASPTFQCADENPGAEGSCQSLNSASAKPLWRECQTVNYAPCQFKETGKFFLDASSPPPCPSQITGSVSPALPEVGKPAAKRAQYPPHLSATPL